MRFLPNPERALPADASEASASDASPAHASPADRHVQQTLVASLYSQPGGLVIGGGCGVLIAWVGALEAQNIAMKTAAALLSVVAGLWLIAAWALPRFKNSRTRLLEVCYALGAFSYNGLCGLLAAQAVAYPMPAAVRMLMIGNTIAYGVGIAAHNAGRPVIAIGQTLLALVPVILACALQPDSAFHYLALSLLVALPVLASITFNAFHVLRNSITAADASEQLAERMRNLALTDVVTGLFNRVGLNHQLAERLQSIAPDKKLALFWLDLDHFKEVNDTLGYQVGDCVLAEVASRLLARAPHSACIARFGGDEFIVACEINDRAETEALAYGFLEEVTRPIRVKGGRLEIASSIGVAILPDDGADLDSGMQAADVALAHGKVNGGKRLSFFDPSMARDLLRRREIEVELRVALQRNELSVYFQPIVDLATGRIRGFEALVRWFHPEKGELRPDEFIPVAEKSGAIITLGNWITAEAARCAAQWPADITLAVNLSPMQIRAPGATLGILNALRAARLDPRRLVLEVTETVLLERGGNTEAFMSELTDLGVSFALDDFGTGYSSLSYLNNYPFSKIKVDRSFVSGASAGLKSDAIIRAVSGMAATLGMEVVAEGLETRAQVDSVRLAGCTTGQGYYFSRAVPADKAALMLRQEQDQDPSARLRA